MGARTATLLSVALLAAGFGPFTTLSTAASGANGVIDKLLAGKSEGASG